MGENLPLFSGLVIALFAVVAYRRYRDAFHPAVFTAPLMLAGYCIWPMLLNRDGELDRLFPRVGDFHGVQAYYLVALFSFYAGAVWTRSRKTKLGRDLSPWRTLAATTRGDRVRARLLRLSVLFALVAQLAYWDSIGNAGGFGVAFSRYKGGGVATSGYLGEATLLAYPAALMYAMTRQGRGFRVIDWIIVLTMLSPNLMQGTLGVRRGPLFISLASLFVAWIVSRGRAPGLLKTGVGITVILVSVIFMWSQRQYWFAKDTDVVEQKGLGTTLLPETYQSYIENDYVSGVGSAIITEYHDGFFWGKRWLVDLVIRPIPAQFWPTKYVDVGAYWKVGGNPTGFETYEQVEALGFPLPAGHSIGVLSDIYSEWWWYGIVVMFGLGRFLRWLWFKHRLVGQVWTALFLASIGLCIYLPTQSFSAWYQRYLIMAVGTMLAWRWMVGGDVRVRRVPLAINGGDQKSTLNP